MPTTYSLARAPFGGLRTEPHSGGGAASSPSGSGSAVPSRWQPYLHAAKGTREAFIGKLLVWDHNALTKIVLNPFLARPILFLLGASALALAPLAYGMSKGPLAAHPRRGHLGGRHRSRLGPGLLAAPSWSFRRSLAPFAAAWWKATALLGWPARPVSRGIHPSLRREPARPGHPPPASRLRPHGPLGSGEPCANSSAPGSSSGRPAVALPSTSRDLKGRLCIGRLYDDGRPTGYFVAPEIAKLQQTLVVAPTGSGKTTSLALPWSRELPGKGSRSSSSTSKETWPSTSGSGSRPGGSEALGLQPAEHGFGPLEPHERARCRDRGLRREPGGHRRGHLRGGQRRGVPILRPAGPAHPEGRGPGRGAPRSAQPEGLPRPLPLRAASRGDPGPHQGPGGPGRPSRASRPT